MSAPEQPAASPPPERRLSPGRRRLFIAIVLLTFAVLQEAACRWLFPLPECDGFNRINYTPLKLFGDDLAQARRQGLSNIKLRWECEPDGFAFDHTLNLYGFRGPNFSLEPSPGRPRVVFVGDSFTEGAGAADGDTIPQQFERLVAGDKPAEAINLGVSGTGLPEYTLLVRDGLSLLKPQALFLVLCYNDLPTEKALSEEAKAPAPAFPRRSPWVPRAVALFCRRQAGQVIPTRIPSGPFPFVSPVPSPTNPLTTQKPPPTIDPQVLGAMRRGKAGPWGFMLAVRHEEMLRFDFSGGWGARDYLRHLAALCQGQGSRLIVVFIPHSVTTNPVYMEAQLRLGAPDYGTITRLDGPVYRSAQRHLRQVTADLGLPFLDMTDEFIEAEKTRGRMFWPIDGHCNAAGYRVVGEVCARYWTNGTLPRAAPSETEPASAR
jgi:lysophospholipase L1-like esterase